MSSSHTFPKYWSRHSTYLCSTSNPDSSLSFQSIPKQKNNDAYLNWHRRNDNKVRKDVTVSSASPINREMSRRKGLLSIRYVAVLWSIKKDIPNGFCGRHKNDPPHSTIAPSLSFQSLSQKQKKRREDIPLVDGLASRFTSAFELEDIAHAALSCQDLCYDILTERCLLFIGHVLVPPRQADLPLSVEDDDKVDLIAVELEWKVVDIMVALVHSASIDVSIGDTPEWRRWVKTWQLMVGTYGSSEQDVMNRKNNQGHGRTIQWKSNPESGSLFLESIGRTSWKIGRASCRERVL